MQFLSLGLSEFLLQSLAAQHFNKPYPIQQEAIPAILAGKDIFGVAQTGSGKTAAFVLPILELLHKKTPPKSRYIKALVLVPTRELAAQVADVFKTFSNGSGRRINTLAVYGGVSINPQMMALAQTEILVATPGRLLDLISSNAVLLSAVEMLVLDEADKILNLGFQEELDKILALLPGRRQNILFSATIGDDVRNIKEALLRDPLLIEVKEENPQHELISQRAYQVNPEQKGPFLRYLIKTQNMQQVLVFTSSVRTADNLVNKLSKNGIQAASLHSQKSQGARTEVLSKFKTAKLRVLVATDLASRGIDIEKLPYVINFELPRSPKDYVHRIGRTGRAAASGEAISLITPEDLHHFGIIQKKMGKKVSVIETSDIDLKGY
ncbi:DEAD/DEAH box helicase [Flammeovirgaceae bacterium 311]|nr:DEAD/DEAH box helicase [Flammeovirgaceae bacterium 311]